MKTTDKIVRKSGLPTQVEESDQRYSNFNTGGIEAEVGEFFWGLVRMVQPETVVETGTHKGISAGYFADALRENGFGKLHTVEFMQENYADAERFLEKLNLREWVKMYLHDASTVEFELEGEIDILLLDTEPHLRFAELLRLFDKVKPGGIIMVHDLHPHMHQVPNEEHGFAWPYGLIPEGLSELVTSGQLRPMHFRTPRGLTLFYKVAPGDYVWEKK